MKIRANCAKCEAKNSLLSVFTRDHYKKDDRNDNDKRKYWTHSDKTAYYICKKCGFHDEFALNRIIMNANFFWAYFVRDQDIQAVKELDNKQKRNCVICQYSTKPPIPTENEISRPAITKLFLKRPKKRFLGYFCAVCRRAYYLPTSIVKWEKGESFKRRTLVDLLEPLNAQLPREVREKHPKYNEEVELIKDERKLDCIGNFLTLKGVPTGDPDKAMITILIPRAKYKRTIDNLKKNGSEIVR